MFSLATWEAAKIALQQEAPQGRSFPSEDSKGRATSSSKRKTSFAIDVAVFQSSKPPIII